MQGIQAHSLVPELRSHNAAWPSKKKQNKTKQNKNLKKPFKVLAKFHCLSSPSVHWDTQCPSTPPSHSASCTPLTPRKIRKILLFSFSRGNENNAHKYIFQTISLRTKHLHPKMFLFLRRIGLYVTLSLSLSLALSLSLSLPFYLYQELRHHATSHAGFQIKVTVLTGVPRWLI